MGGVNSMVQGVNNTTKGVTNYLHIKNVLTTLLVNKEVTNKLEGLNNNTVNKAGLNTVLVN
ncbi:hypothetical protein CWI38_0597p0030 [Hamiltosporidium tvaerminnensis]|uniref:Uncharacterized protein n=1 Tax=Hamiltosporidium tvaerminnensis TaxID=1176355 RepID=A0A4Q9LX32_9MICR|nr:hypothetical protein CWI38_0597p0030 [Hamiltosporidium tvaerminnensis]